MKKYSFILIFLFNYSIGNAQLEISTGYAINRHLADGAPIQIGYDFKLNNKLYTKSQIGYKYLYHFNDFVGAKIKVSILEFHQTFSYELVKKKKYIFKPNIGLNFRNYSWYGKMSLPYNTLPQRVYYIEFRNKTWLKLNSYDNQYSDTYHAANLGFSIQLQSQFKINKKLWLQITPFLEPDYDASQNTGGCYIGVIFKNL